MVFLLAALFFVITMMTYVEGNALHPERGGASTFARYAVLLALIVFEGTTYSVPCTWACLDVIAHVGPDTIDFVGKTGSVTRRRGRFGERVIDYCDYVPELAKKPQAVRQVAAHLVRDLGEPFGRAWRALVDAHGPKQAARLVQVLQTSESARSSTIPVRA